MIWYLFVLTFIIALIFLAIGIVSGKKVYYAISFLFFLCIGLFILGTGLNLPSGVWTVA